MGSGTAYALIKLGKELGKQIKNGDFLLIAIIVGIIVAIIAVAIYKIYQKRKGEE